MGPLTSGLQDLVEVLGEHLSPGGPVVVPVGAPEVHSVGNALGAQDMGHLPGLAGRFPATLTGSQHDVTASQALELLTFTEIWQVVQG